MAWSNVTCTLVGGANVSTTLTTTNWPDAQQQVAAMGVRGFWFTNTAAGVIYNQFVPPTAILTLTVV